jgi:fatty-acyl-CoA synthase
MNKGFLSAFLERASEQPDAVAFTLYKGGTPHSLTYANLISGAHTYAGALRDRGAIAGEVVLISLKLSPDLIQSFLGALFVGCIPSMMPHTSVKQDPYLFWHSHEELFRHLKSRIIITYPENKLNIERNINIGFLTVLTPDDVRACSTAHSVPPGDIHSWGFQNICCLQHSSGTTGLKKGVTLTFDAIDMQICNYARKIGLTNEDNIVSWLPLYHDMGFIACFLSPLTIGCHTVMLDPFEWIGDPLSLFESIVHHNGSYTWLPNFAFNHLVNTAVDDARKVDLSHVRAFINCSEPCKAETFRSFAARFASWGVRPDQLAVCYAMAESVFAVSQTSIGQAPRVLTVDQKRLSREKIAHPAVSLRANDTLELLSTGCPLSGVEIAIVDPDSDSELLPDGAVGQIALRGEFVFKGYFKDPSRTNDVFHNGYFMTGDIGFRFESEIYVLGRRNDLIIVLGKNFFAHEIEELMNGIAGVKAGRAVALGLYNERIGSEDLIIIAEVDETHYDQRAIRTRIKKTLESSIGLVPKKILLVERGWLVKSTSGKISRSENLLKYLSTLTSGTRP